MNPAPGDPPSPTSLIDIHTHLDGFIDADVGRLLHEAALSGVGAVVTAGTTLDTSVRAVRLAEEHDSLFASVGVHPTDLTGPLDEMTERALAELAESDRVVAISEVGLDFQERSPDRAVQYQAFRRQIGVARELGLPIVFHSRDAPLETLRVLREERGFEVGGAMHYFQYDAEAAREAMDLGFYISLARPLLRLPELQEVAAGLPLDRVVLETDAYPQPFKKDPQRRTEPRHTREVAKELARLKDVTLDEVAGQTSANALAMLGARGAALAQRMERLDRTIVP
jgi:TatD DNase family protein